MNIINQIYIVAFALLGMLSCETPSETQQASENWQLTPFVKVDSVNPVLLPGSESVFYCPVRQDSVYWEAKDVFNPAAVVREGKVWLLYRAEDSVGRYNGTSRLGLAISEDGMRFRKWPEPVFYPDEDSVKKYEWEGGCEDPRLVEDETGRYILTYTSYDGQTARLCIASSMDLVKWEKYGPLFRGEHEGLWSKSGSIVCRQEGERLVATRVAGKYWMYWGDTDMFAATSEDLIHWIPLLDEKGALLPVFKPRPGYFDSDLVEPGPPAMITERGILLMYNSRNAEGAAGDTLLPALSYAAGQVLMDSQDPSQVLERMEKNFIHPNKDYEISGQVNQVCFIEGLVYFQGKWFLYYGTADSKIALAVCEENL